MRHDLLIGCALLALCLAAGCQKDRGGIRQLTGQPPALTTCPSADCQIDLLMPRSIEILPFTRPATFDEDLIPDGIEVVLRPLDAFGDQTKAVGLFRFELYQFRKASSEPRGHRLGVWQVDVSTKAAQKSHWDRITRTYRFRLLWTGRRAVEAKYILEVTFMSQWGRRLSSLYTIVPQAHRMNPTEKSEQRQKRWGIF